MSLHFLFRRFEVSCKSTKFVCGDIFAHDFEHDSAL